MPKETKSTIIAVVAVVAALFLLYFVFVRPMMMSGDARVLLVASDVLAQAGGKSKLESYLSSANVAVVPYNYDRVATYAELGDLIKGHLDATGASRVRSVGIMYHTPNRYNLKCFASDPEKSTVSGSLESFEPFRRFVVALRGAYGVEDVDLVSCDVVSAESSVLSALDFNGARVNASTNTTGQVKQGPVGDWVLEAGNVNLIGRYFKATITTVDIALSSSRFKTYRGPKPSAQNQGGIVGYQGNVSGIERQNQKEQFDAWQAGLSEGAQAYQNKFNDAIGRELSEKNHRRDQAIVEQKMIGRGRYNKYSGFEQWV